MAEEDDQSSRAPFEKPRPPQDKRGWRPQTFAHLVQGDAQVEQLNAAGGIAVEFARLSKQPVDLSFEGAQSRTLCVWTTSSRQGFLSVPKMSADLFTLRFVTGGAIIRNNVRSEAVISRADYGTFVDFQDMRDEQASTDFSAISATVTRAKIMEASFALDGEESSNPLSFLPSVELKTRGLRLLHRTLVSLHTRLRGASRELDLLAPILEEVVVYQFLSVWPSLGGQCPTGSSAPSSALKRSIDYIEANLGRRMTLAEIAGAGGMGVRTLQLAFKRELGCSPITYLIDRRLDLAHAAILASEGRTLRDIAAEWGFVHMSDFTRRYRDRFGQPPSKTAHR